MKKTSTKVCPYCGETIAVTATACPACGSDEQTGWSEQTYLDGIDIGDDETYEDAVQREFAPHKYKSSLLYMIIAFFLLILFVLMVLKSILM